MSLTLSGGILQLRNDGAGGTGISTVNYGNGVTVTGNTSIDVNNGTGGVTNKTLSLGTFSIGTNTVNVTGGNGYSLATGAVTLNLNGGISTFNPTTANVTLASVTSNLGSGKAATIAL